MTSPTERDLELARQVLALPTYTVEALTEAIAVALAQAREGGTAILRAQNERLRGELDACETELRLVNAGRNTLLAEVERLRGLLEETRHVWELLPLEWEERVCAALDEGANDHDPAGYQAHLRAKIQEEMRHDVTLDGDNEEATDALDDD